MTKENFTPERLEKLCVLLCRVAARLEAEEEQQEQEISDHGPNISEEGKKSA